MQLYNYFFYFMLLNFNICLMNASDNSSPGPAKKSSGEVDSIGKEEGETGTDDGSKKSSPQDSQDQQTPNDDNKDAGSHMTFKLKNKNGDSGAAKSIKIPMTQIKSVENKNIDGKPKVVYKLKSKPEQISSDGEDTSSTPPQE